MKRLLIAGAAAALLAAGGAQAQPMHHSEVRTAVHVTQHTGPTPPRWHVRRECHWRHHHRQRVCHTHRWR